MQVPAVVCGGVFDATQRTTQRHRQHRRMDDNKRDDALPALSLGDHVSDCDGGDEKMVVVGISATRADDYRLGDEGADRPPGGYTSVADVNIDYPDDDAVIEVAYQQHGLQLDLDNTYAFPRSRLRLEQPLTD